MRVGIGRRVLAAAEFCSRAKYEAFWDTDNILSSAILRSNSSCSFFNLANPLSYESRLDEPELDLCSTTSGVCNPSRSNASICARASFVAHVAGRAGAYSSAFERL